MNVSPKFQSIAIGQRVVIQAGPFKAGEEVSIFVFGMFAKKYPDRLMTMTSANGQGYAKAGYVPSVTPDNSRYKNPYLCLRGESSNRLACAEFQVIERSHNHGTLDFVPTTNQQPVRLVPQPLPNSDRRVVVPSPSGSSDLIPIAR